MAEDDADLSPAAAFDLVGHDVRMDIIRELARLRRTNWQWQGMTFAELRRAVGVRDGGNFTYHLDKLLGHFVVKDGDEYKLTNAGMELVGAVRSGSLIERGESFEEQTGTTCPVCDEPLTAEYERGFLSLICEEHDVLFGTSIPSGASRGRTPAEVVRFATMNARQDVERARAGGCPHCWGPMSVTMDPEEVEFPRWDDVTDRHDDLLWAEFECDRCEMQFWLPPGACVVSDPPVVAFYHDVGVDLRDLAYPELSIARPDLATVTSTGPLRIRVDVERDGNELTIWLDEDAEIAEYERG